MSYCADGYYYAVTVPTGLPDLIIEVFDAPWINTGTTCGDNLNNATQACNNLRRRHGRDDRLRVWERQRLLHGRRLRLVRWLHRRHEHPVRGAQPGTELLGRQLVPVLNTTGCAPTTYPGYTGQLRNPLTLTNASYDDYLARNFRRWTTLCMIDHQPGAW